jgi:hypothetical protein
MEANVDGIRLNMSIPEYIQSSYSTGDWLTRHLINHSEGRLIESHLELAKEILERKFLIGLHDFAKESMQRFEDYYQWDQNLEAIQCRNSTIDSYFTGILDDGENEISLNQESEEYKLILENNRFDMELYDYAVLLFRQQDSYIQSMKEGPIP